jgi:hypothetical protein
MTKTTPPPPVEIVELFPWLGRYASSSIRLHPRPCGSLPAHASKMGGLFLWPHETRWPVCNARDADELFDFSRPENVEQLSRFLEHAYEAMEAFGPGKKPSEPARRRWIAQHVDELHELERRRRHGHNQPYIPLLQLRRDEYPALPFPGNTDLFQLLLCPHVHFLGPPKEEPGHAVVWRRQQDVDEPLLKEPRFEEGLGIQECSLSPEIVNEYPQSKVFESHFQEDLNRLLEKLAHEAAPSHSEWTFSGSDLYDEALSVSAGTKLFGYPRWIQEPQHPACGCGRRMTLLVTIAASEYHHELGGLRWRPWEEREHRGTDRPLGLSIGDSGAIYLFYCPHCPGPVTQAVVQERRPH